MHWSYAARFNRRIGVTFLADALVKTVVRTDL
jgi:hypothetical protein